MILLREIEERDLDGLEKLSQIPGMFNLRGSRNELLLKIRHSVESFRGTLKHKNEAKFIFVAENLEKNQIVGTSQLAAQHGTNKSPHFYFQVGTERRFSRSISTGFIHGTLELKFDVDGPSEIGGLVVDPASRNSSEKIGRQISFVRFAFMASHLSVFRPHVIAELLPPLTKEGHSSLWEAIGRRFTNMDYWEADRFCLKNKEFIFSLFPAGKIYTTFLTPEARNSIGQVGDDTKPVYYMLEKIGFQYKNQVDPFDGGPHLWGATEKILPIKKTAHCKVNSKLKTGKEFEGLIAVNGETQSQKKQFKAMHVNVMRKGQEIKLVDNDQNKAVADYLKITNQSTVWFTPYY